MPQLTRAREYRARRRTDARTARRRARGARRAPNANSPNSASSCRSTFRVSQLSVGQQQVVEIAKALARNGAHHRDGRTDRGAQRTRDRTPLRDRRAVEGGQAPASSTSRIAWTNCRGLPIASRCCVTVSAIETRAAAEFPADEIVRAMVGRRLESHFPELPPVAPDAPVVLEVRDLVASRPFAASRSPCVPARSSGWRAWSAPAVPRSCARSPAPTFRTAARFSSTVAASPCAHPKTASRPASRSSRKIARRRDSCSG